MQRALAHALQAAIRRTLCVGIVIAVIIRIIPHH